MQGQDPSHRTVGKRQETTRKCRCRAKEREGKGGRPGSSVRGNRALRSSGPKTDHVGSLAVSVSSPGREGSFPAACSTSHQDSARSKHGEGRLPTDLLLPDVPSTDKRQRFLNNSAGQKGLAALLSLTPRVQSISNTYPEPDQFLRSPLIQRESGPPAA